MSTRKIKKASRIPVPNNTPESESSKTRKNKSQITYTEALNRRAELEKSRNEKAASIRQGKAADAEKARQKEAESKSRKQKEAESEARKQKALYRKTESKARTTRTTRTTRKAKPEDDGIFMNVIPGNIAKKETNLGKRFVCSIRSLFESNPYKKF